MELRENLGAGDPDLGYMGIRMAFIRMIFKTRRPV